MKFQLIVQFVLCILSVPSDGLLEGFGRQTGPCFPVKDRHPQCTETLVESFQPSTETAEGHEPETFVYLFTPKSPDVAEELHLCGGRLPPNSTYDPNVYTVVIIHGWLDGVCRTAWMREVKEQYFLCGKYNIILVDWTWGNTPDILVAAVNCRVVGEQMAFVINNIKEQTGNGPENFHIIGHSLGAYSAGFIGRNISGLGRATGLDPYYQDSKLPPEKRLTYTDAKYVDIIHTNGGQCFATHSGDIRQLGRADFYPDGGSIQTSSYYAMMEAFLKGDLFYAIACLYLRICYHLQATQYYKVSINPGDCQFVGRESESYEEFLIEQAINSPREWRVMGKDSEECSSTNDTIRRKYYLKTSNVCPYCIRSDLGSSCKAKCDSSNSRN